MVINTLGGAYRLSCNRQVKDHKEEAHVLLNEAWELSKKLFATDDSNLSVESMQAKLWQLVEATAGNENSMAKDVRLGRKTESDFLAGVAMDKPGCPTMKRLHQAIKANRPA